MEETQVADAGAPGAAGAHNPGESGSTPEPATTPTSGRWARAMRTNRGANGGATRLPPGQQWASHDGTQAQLRRYRQAWALYEKQSARDGYAKATRERLLDYVAELGLNEQAAEIVTQGLVLRAHVMATEVGLTWTTALNRMLNELEEAEAEKKRKAVDPSVGVRLSNLR